MEAIGTALARVASSETVLPARLPERPIASDPTTMAECNALAEWAESLPITAPAPASPAALTKNLQLMQAALPARSVDEAAGERRTAVYLAVLQSYSLDAIKFLTERAIRTLQWFPTPKDCLDILAEYRPPVSERAATLQICGRFRQHAFDQWEVNVRAGQPIGNVPDQWLRIGEAQGYLRRLADGVYVPRQAYAGPLMPVPAL
jgi:hypothetical protein